MTRLNVPTTIPNKPIPGTANAKLPPAPSRVPRIGGFSAAPQSVQLRTLQGRFSSGWGVVWTGLNDVEALFGKIEGAAKKASEEASRDIGRYAVEYAKQEARWSDQTGQARGSELAPEDESSLHYAVAAEGDGEFSTRIAHGVPYGVFLEARPEFAILAEALAAAFIAASSIAQEALNREVNAIR